MTQITINTLKISIIFYLLFFTFPLLAQQVQKAKPNWQHLDLKADGIFGISTEKAYTQLLKGKTAVPVTVAIIDGGVDINHQELKASIWTNPNEIAGNGKDDDGNGYIDDIHGWNFDGSSKGSFHFDNKELVRLLRSALKNDPQSAKVKDLQHQLDDKRNALEDALKVITIQRNVLTGIKRKLGKEYPDIEEFKSYKYQTGAEAQVLVMIVNGLKTDPDFIKEFEDRYHDYNNQLNYSYNINYDPRKGNAEYKGDFYGNGDVNGLDPSHGTHIAGIIAALPNLAKGIKGIATNAKIMSIIAIPEGDALDQDLAKAIRYAADNGAKIINISESKDTSPDRKTVDEAVQYAMAKGVLIVHSAGNKGEELDAESSVFPSRTYLSGRKADAWIEVGASGPQDNENLMAWFSNYGQKTVDVFAPGVDIYSTYPQNSYKYESGTSMAAPVVSGLAAFIWSYYPRLNAIQVKEIIMGSVVKVNHKVKNNNGGILDFSSVCISGGIINAFKALQLAERNYH